MHFAFYYNTYFHPKTLLSVSECSCLTRMSVMFMSYNYYYNESISYYVKSLWCVEFIIKKGYMVCLWSLFLVGCAYT